MPMKIGLGIGIGSKIGAVTSAPTTCLLAADLTSGEAKAVTGTGATERWYKYVVTADGTLTVATASTTGTPNVTVYRGPCESLVQLDTWTGDDTGDVAVEDGDVIIVKLNGTDFTADVTATYAAPAGIVSAATTAAGDGVAFTFSAAAATQPFNGELTIKVNGVTRWTWDDNFGSTDVGTTSTLEFSGTPIANGDVVTATSVNNPDSNWIFINGGAAVPAFTDFPVTNVVP